MVTESFKYEVKGLDELLSELKKVAKQSNMTEKEIDEMFSSVEKGSKKTSKETKNVGGGFNGLSAIAGKAGAAMVAAFAVEKIIEYGKKLIDIERKYYNLEKQISRFSGLSGTALDKATSKVEALSIVYKKDLNETLLKSQYLSTQLGTDLTGSLSLIEKGFLAGADSQGKFFSFLDSEYPKLLQQAGLVEDQILQIAIKSNEFYGDKFEDGLKEAIIAISQFEKAQRDALAPLGQGFTNKLYEDIATKAITPIEALKRIDEQSQKVNLTTQEHEKITADVFKAAGEDIGGYQNVLKGLREAMEINLDVTNEYTEAEKEELKVATELADEKQRLAENVEGLSKNFDTLTSKITTQVISAFNNLYESIFKTETLIKRLNKETDDIGVGKNFSELTVLIAESEEKLKGFIKEYERVKAVDPELDRTREDLLIQGEKDKLKKLRKLLIEAEKQQEADTIAANEAAFKEKEKYVKKLTDAEKKANEERLKKQKEIALRELKASRELSISKLEAEIEYNERSIENNKNKFEKQLILNVENKDKALEILTLQYQNEIEGADLTKTEKLVIDEEYKQKRNDILRESTEYQLELWEKELTANKEKSEKMAADQRQYQIEELQMNYDMANAMLVDSLLKGEVTEKDFYKKRKTLARENTQAEIDLLYEQFKEVELNSDEETRILEEINEKRKELREEDLEDFLDKEAQKKEIIDASIEAAISVANSLFEISTSFREQEIEQIERQKEYELHAAGENAEAKKRIEEKYNREIAQQKRKQAQNDKLAAIFNVGVSTAEAIMKVSSQLGAFAVPMQILIGIQGAAQIAAIAAQPIPKFNKGTEYVPGVGNTDTVPALLTPGERIFTKEQNAAIGGIPNTEAVDLINFGLTMKNLGFNGSGINEHVLSAAIEKAVKEGFSSQTIYNTNWTEKGVQRSVTKGMQTTIILNSENK
ncbi:hypothetical protein V9L05_18755 [Bernardetia sp. Wsw4-3y2]|uniref:hypothetical protein n=1 Tax=Bernardetia sp. Wsw4-3y2 TaxID=3127471 RepID=UPI0030D48245